MKPPNLKTKLFLDSGDPKETQEALNVLGFLDGQTTNPTLISKNPQVKEQIESGKKFTKDEIYHLYKNVVTKVSSLIPEGSVSIEVYSDKTTPHNQMLQEGQRMFSWIPNAHIKYPVTTEGLKAAELSIKEGIRVNITLVFSQEQGAAVYAATKGAKRGNAFLSPFIGRLDDLGLNGMDIVKNTIEMYKQSDGHVEVLTASVRKYEHFLTALQLGSDIITAPLEIYKEWAAKGMTIPTEFVYNAEGLTSIQYQQLDLNKNWQEYDIQHKLTDKGIDKFTEDWNSLIL